MKFQTCIIFIIWFVLLSCGNSSKSSSEYMPINDEMTSDVDFEDGRGGYDDYPETTDDDRPDIDNIRLTGEIVQCNKCMGYGMIQDGLYGQPVICKFCWMSTWMRIQHGWNGFDGRYGQVDAVFNTLPPNYFDSLDWNIEDEPTGEVSNEQIELQISRHEENMSELEAMLEYIDGAINRAQIQQQIIEEQSEIRRLKAILNNLE